MMWAPPRGVPVTPCSELSPTFSSVDAEQAKIIEANPNAAVIERAIFRDMKVLQD
jgi:hypothetical protein